MGLSKHHVFNIKWIGFPNTYKKVQGVYCIGEYYVGASRHIRKRILSHCHKVKRGEVNLGCDKDLYIRDCLKNDKPIKVSLLSKNPYNEGYWQELILGNRDPNTYEKAYKDCKI